MIERNGDTFDIDCDHCFEFLVVKAETWADMIREMRSQDWHNIKRKKGDWLNLCPVCSGKYFETRKAVG